MPVENTIQFGQSASAQAAREAAAKTAAGSEAPAAAPVAPVLPQPSVRVSVSGSELDKLVAKVKGESDDVRLEVARRRIGTMLSLLSSLHLEQSTLQSANFARLGELREELDGLDETLRDAQSDLVEADARATELELATAALEKAVENAVKDGAEHRKLVEELKRTRKEDDEELLAAEEALAAAEAAEAAARENLGRAQENLDAAKERCDSIRGDIADAEARIASARNDVSECVAALGDKTIAALASAIRANPPDAAPDVRETTADREKEEAKEAANDPLRAVREALDRMDEDIRRAVDENRTVLV